MNAEHHAIVFRLESFAIIFFNIPVEFETVSRNFFEKEINP